MARDSGHFLNELPIWKLKMVATEYRIDVSSCRYKRDFIGKIRAKKLTEQQVRSALAKAKNEPAPRVTPSQEAAEVQEIGRDIEKIAQKPAEPTELPTDDEKSVEKHIDEALTMKPSFFGVDSITESALNRMIVGDYYDAIRLSREARMECLESFSTFQVYSAAVSIRAADELLARIPDGKGRLDPNLRTAVAAAKRAFLGGSPRQREETLESLETLASKTYSAFIADTEKKESELKELLADYESFGTRTEESRKYLEIAASAKQAFDFTQYDKFMHDAREGAAAARDVRKNEIDNAFHIVRASAAEARDVGADTTSVESNLGEARRAFEEGAFKRAVDLLAAVEMAADDAHLQRIKAQRELETRQREKADFTLRKYGPILKEASGYGINVQESTAYMDAVSNSLARKDIVAAAKYARRVREKTDAMEKDLDQKRLELGVIKHVDDAKCGKCGQASLYVYPDANQKCLECGHTFTANAPPAEDMIQRSAAVEKDPEVRKPVPIERKLKGATAKEPPQKAPEKKRKGFLKW
ncbi:MAG: hypothetical protein KJ672_07665 [Candidatus Thermoplasmatota archaeon]|nr:hypothetical protein [Candidatus Thermoplasmatota archaeon]